MQPDAFGLISIYIKKKCGSICFIKQEDETFAGTIGCNAEMAVFSLHCVIGEYNLFILF